MISSKNVMLIACILTTCLTFARAASAQSEAGDASFVIEEVIVTAQRREQNLQQVPLAITAMSGEQLANSQITSTSDLVRVVPTLTFTDAAFPTNASFRLRGAGTQSSSTSVEPSVSLVFDGVVVTRPAQGIADIVDIERIEVMRGPQSTLFGKNASAGVVHVITKRPSTEFEGAVEAMVAEDGQYGFKGTVSGPISDSVGYRLSGHYRNDDGFLTNIATGTDINGTENYALRGKLEFQPTDALNILVAADFSETDADCCALMPLINPNGPDPDGFLDLVDPSIATEDSRDVNQTSDPRQEQEGWGTSVEINYDFDWGGTLTSITAYRDWNYDGTQADIDYQPLTGGTAVPGFAFTFTRHTPQYGLGFLHDNQTFSQELRIASPSGEKVEWVAGVFYWTSDYHQNNTERDATCLIPGGYTGTAMTACPAASEGFRSRIIDIDTSNTNTAIFGQVNWYPSDSLELFVGLRYINEELEWGAVYPDSPAPGFPDDAVSRFGAPGPLPYNEAFESDDSDWSGRLGAVYDVSDNARIFGTYSRGYKGPASNTNGFNFSEEPVNPETVDSFELGWRSELAEGRINLNITAFHSMFEDFQSQSIDQVSQSFMLTNVGEFRTQGIELEMTALVTEDFDINTSVAYTDAEFESFPDAQCYVGQTPAEGCIDGSQDLTGAQSPNSPDWKFNLGARYQFPLGSLQGFVNGTYVWQDEIFFREDQNPFSVQESYGLFDLSFGATTQDGRITGTVFVKNLFDEHWAANRFQIGLPPGNANPNMVLARNADRYVGASLRFDF